MEVVAGGLFCIGLGIIGSIVSIKKIKKGDPLYGTGPWVLALVVCIICSIVGFVILNLFSDISSSQDMKMGIGFFILIAGIIMCLYGKTAKSMPIFGTSFIFLISGMCVGIGSSSSRDAPRGVPAMVTGGWVLLILGVICLIPSIIHHIKHPHSTSAIDPETQAFIDSVKDVANNKSYYISLAELKGNGELIKELYSDFDAAFTSYMNSLTDHSMALMGQQRALKSHKIDPYIAGGAASSLGGLGIGIAAAGSSAARNNKIDANREYYNSQVKQTGSAQNIYQNRLMNVVAEIKSAAGVD